ncbi:MAG: translocation/assembly module TamB domain-containing protein [Leptolyngbya sp. SIO1E4]|nr:translocation/assembly module TamB domain-containing protein [Leptolyngbya sp. SIO1E4]
MSNAPPEEQAPSGTTNNRRRIWATTGLTLGALATLAAVGGAWWAWVFVNERLSPWVSELLTESLDRPVSLGEVERVSLTGIQFGPSAMPPTEADPDTLYVESIQVRFNPLQLLRRRISPRINLIGAQAYIAQDEDDQWLDVEIDLEEDEDRDPFIQVDPVIGIEDSEVALLPYLGEDETPLPLTIGSINGRVGLEKIDVNDPRNPDTRLEAQEIDLEITASPENAGTLIVNGVIQTLDYGEDTPASPLDTVDANLAVQAQQLDLAVLAPVILASLPQDVPLTVTTGTLNGNLEADLTPQEAPQITGTARLDEGAIAVDGLPKTIDDISAQARFQGNRVALENVTAAYANISARAGGLIDTRNGYDLSGEIAPFELSELVEELEIDLPVAAEGTFRAEATMTGPLADPKVTGQLLSTDVVTIDRVQFANLVTELIYTPAELILSSLEIEPLDGGSLTGSGTYRFSDPAELSLQLEGRDLPADAIGRAYGLPDNITLGAVALDADVSGPLDDLSGLISWQAPGGTIPSRGTAEVVASTVRIREAIAEVAGGTVSGTGTLAQGDWDVNLIAQGIQLGVFDQSLQGGIASGNVQLAGSLDDLSLRGIRGNGDITTSLRGGTFNSQIALADGNWDADVQTRNFPVGQFLPGVPITGVTADARLSGNIDNLTLAAIRGEGTVSAAIAGGTVTSDIQLENGFWQASGEGSSLQLAQLVPELQGTGGGTFQLAGSLDNLTPAGIRGRANLVLSDGLATAASLSPQLARSRSPLTASLEWDGQQIQVDSLETAGLFASGTITPRLSGPGAPSIAAVDLALSARDYALSALPVAFPPALALTGQATFDGRLTGTPDDLNLVGSLQLANLALNDLIFDPLLAGDVQFSSQEGLAVSLLGQQDEISVNYDLPSRQVNFRVQASDAIATGETEGDLLQTQLYNFPISALNIPPADSSPYGALRGEVTFATAAINLRDFTTVGQLDVRDLGWGYLSVDRVFGGFNYANGVAALNNGEIRMADTDARGEVIATRIYDFSGRYGFNQTPQIQATVSTEAGELRDILKVLKITELADFQRGFIPDDGFIPDSQAEAEAALATTPAGNPNATLLNQLRRLAEIRELEDQEARETQTATLPPLSDLQGTFRGQVDFAATLPDDITARFDIEGQSWTWGPDYRADAVLARGSYDNGLVSFAPLRFRSAIGEEPAYIDLAGQFSLDPEDQQNRVMELEVVNLPADRIPIDTIPGLANAPLDIGGKLHGTATLSGRLADPNVAGSFQLVEGTLNRNPIQRFNVDLEYREARLGLDAELELINSDDPLTLSAQVPYRLPFVERSPSRNDFFVNADVKDEGFALLNLLTRQVAWEAGEGEAILRLAGTWDEGTFPAIDRFDGLVLLREATLAFEALPTSMTNVTGQIRLDPLTLSIVVDRLTGQFSDGELSAQGSFPLFSPLPDIDAANGAVAETGEQTPPDLAEADTSPEEANPEGADPEGADPEGTDPEGAETPASPAIQPITQRPLALDLSNIDLNLKGLYSGQVNGQVIVGGSAAFGPELTGEIELSRGTITIPESGDTTQPTAVNGSAEAGTPVRFSDLRIVLDRNIRIVQGGLLDVRGRGGLSLNGTLSDPRPFGRVLLPSGRVGLFAVSLRLAGENDRAEFRGNFDPILDVTLQTSIPEAASGGILPTTSPFPQNEIPDNAIEDLGLTQQGNRLVRINARYTGRVSELSDLTTDRRNLELTSSPVRSESELITLLSGNVIGALGALESGDFVLEQFATFAGAALLGTIRDFLGDTIPLSEFRIFQVTESSGEVNESQEIGGEIGFDVTSNISVSVLKVLTNDTPFQFNVRYRISDQFTLRGTTSFEDFQDRTGVLLEYETRF